MNTKLAFLKSIFRTITDNALTVILIIGAFTWGVATNSFWVFGAGALILAIHAFICGVQTATIVIEWVARKEGIDITEPEDPDEA
ncbi:hypothetical protein [Leifsonia sp. Leaf264]|uniref:hypothetical protein n=1 Tax=Leifsonia sp. Leaf264 TaxID=1736314 RepID=UPI0006F90F58|nr:hypothetical protein [Leifsonia sp. Leaf264]KQP01377.1 hypothetical protein ASF30_01815 [Leifsonia sp. Leaf264]